MTLVQLDLTPLTNSKFFECVMGPSNNKRTFLLDFLVGFVKSIKYCNHFTNYSLVINPDSAISIMLPVGVP